MSGWIDISCAVGGWTVVGFAAVLLAWWLLGTPRWRTAAGMRRCAGCLYDMTGVSGVCPECGRAASASRWRFGGRRWRTAVLAVLLLGPGYVLCKVPEVRAKGWARLVPTTVLAAWPMDVMRLVQDDRNIQPEGWSQTQLAQRLETEVPGDLAEWLLARRLRAAYAAQGALWDGADREGDDLKCAVMDMRPLWRSEEKAAWTPRAPMSGVRTDAHVQSAFTDIAGAVLRIWPEDDDGEWEFASLSQHIIVRARPERLARVKRFLHAAARCTPEQPDVKVDGMLIWTMPEEGWRGDDSVASAAALCIREMVSRDSWRDFGGDEGLTATVRDRVVVRGPEPLVDRAGEVLGMIASCERTGTPGRTGPYDAHVSFGNRPPIWCRERVAAWNLRTMFDIERGELDVDQTLEHRFGELHKTLRDGVDPDGWREDYGERLMAVRVGSCLVLWTTREEAIAEVGQVLRWKAAVEGMRTKR